MCGRYTETATLEVLKRRFGFEVPAGLGLKPRYNLAPGQEAPVVVWEERPVLRLLTWGLVPSWAREPVSGGRLINARAETLGEKPSFRGLLSARRCLVLADGFFEWADKSPVRFTLRDGGPFAFAGLWDAWGPREDEKRTFAIVTTAANESVRPVHKRMPVILLPGHEALWLGREPLGQASLSAILAPYPAPLERRPASRLVNSPKNDGPECLL